MNKHFDENRKRLERSTPEEISLLVRETRKSEARCLRIKDNDLRKKASEMDAEAEEIELKLGLFGKDAV
jgi:hypothetical protein